MSTSLNDIGPCVAIQSHLLEFGLFNIIAEQLSARFNELILSTILMKLVLTGT